MWITIFLLLKWSRCSCSRLWAWVQSFYCIHLWEMRWKILYRSRAPIWKWGSWLGWFSKQNRRVRKLNWFFSWPLRGERPGTGYGVKIELWSGAGEVWQSPFSWLLQVELFHSLLAQRGEKQKRIRGQATKSSAKNHTVTRFRTSCLTLLNKQDS